MEPDSAQILNVSISWNDAGTRGQFVLDKTFCAERFLPFFSYFSEESLAVDDFLCIHYETSPDTMSPIWVAHCIIDQTSKPDILDKNPTVTIKFYVHHHAQPTPQGLAGKSKMCTVQWLPLPLPLR